MSVTLIYNFHAADGNAETLREILQQVRDLGLTVEGCEGYEIYQGQEEPNRFAMIEHWASVEAHQAFFEKNVKTTGVLDRVAALVSGPLQGAYYLKR